MDEQFDNHLKDHIREVFDNFEDPTADAGWLLLREKFPAKKKDRGIIWLWLGSAAAILLLLLGIGTWVNYQKVEPKKFSYKPSKILHPENKIAGKTQPSLKDHDTLNNAVKNSAVIVNHTLANNQSKKSPAYKYPAINTGKNPAEKPDSNNSYTAANLPAEKAIDKTKIADNTPAKTQVASNDTAAKTRSVAAIPQGNIKPKNPFTDNPGNYNQAKETAKNDADNKKVLFSVYAATYFNYAKGSDNQLNLGVGVTSDIRLTENLKLSTGIAIAQNSLGYTNQVPAQVQQAYFSAIPSPLRYTNPLAAGLSSIGYIAPTLKNYNAQLVGLDIPVNLKYEFNPQKNDSYFAVGLSSGTFINESYTYQYGYANTNTTQTQTTNSGFSNFYFAKTLNVSFGVGYPLGKTNRLIIEPFLKYPLEGLGEQQIRFGAGGVNLKFNFQSSKK